ncbi:MAG: ATP-binding protein [Eubacteriales bacterium]
MEWIDRLWDRLYGNDLVKKSLRADLASGRLAHAYLLEGPEGSGKTTLALTVCAALSEDSRMAERIFAGNCPDVMTVRRKEDRKTLGVDEIRAMRSSAYIKPNDLEFKAYLLEDGGTMTVQAQNALLKLLEEPPGNVYFFLMCENAAALLPTVRSRAPTLRMQTFSSDELSDYLIANDKKAKILKNNQPDAFGELLTAAGGSIGQAQKELSGSSAGKSDLRDRVIGFVETLAAKNPTEITLACLGLPSKREELSDFYHLTRLALRDLMALRCLPDPELLFGDGDRLRALVGRMSQSRLLLLEEEIAGQEELLASNINLQNSRISLSAAIAQIK